MNMINLSRRLFVAGAAALPMACSKTGNTVLPEEEEAAPIPVNPLVRQRADAQIFRHDDGNYYMTGSVPEYDRLVLRRSPTLAGLSTAKEVVLWRHEASGPLSGFIWAPELHMVDGKWIVYFAAGPSGGGEDVFRIRTYAVVCDGTDPMKGKWSVLGEFKTPWDSFNLDSTIFTHRGKQYFVWAQREPGIETNSNLYIAPLATPLTLAAKATRLTVPTLEWEIQGYKVNEAPAILARNGRLFMTYSASATDSRYCLGMLTAADDADIMDPATWTKSPQPVFKSCEETSVYGPGHNSFTVDEKGRDILVYHGRDYKEIKGDPLFDPNRHTRVQRLYYHEDGTPDFGVPVGNGPLPERFINAASKNIFLTHKDGNLLAGRSDLPATQFRSLPALGGKDGVMLSPIMMPGHFVVAGDDGVLTLKKNDGSPEFAQRSRFARTASTTDETISFLSAAVPGKAIAAEGNNILLLDKNSPAAYWTAD